AVQRDDIYAIREVESFGDRFDLNASRYVERAAQADVQREEIGADADVPADERAAVRVWGRRGGRRSAGGKRPASSSLNRRDARGDVQWQRGIGLERRAQLKAM